MPEEINRLLTDRLSDLLFTPSADGDANLLQEGIAPEKIHLVGNVMIDTLIRLLPAAAEMHIDGLPPQYALVTLHRPSNVDDPQMLRQILTAMLEVSRDLQVIFPVHPRTRQRISQLGLPTHGIRIQDPVPYLEFLALQRRATVVLTDSGGVQEETTYLGIPCLTIRPNTERPVTVDVGTNVLIGSDMKKLRFELAKALAGGGKKGSVPPLWDGRASERIANILAGKTLKEVSSHVAAAAGA
jgi:UDP-N-acetylglucosamine 2-epimerase (non-hydrolysing)